MMLSVIIPAYNEESTIEEVIRKVQEVSIEKEIIVVDDGSTDETGARVRHFVGETIILYTHGKNFGKGEAIRTALEHATGEAIIIQDADLELDPREYLNLLEPIARKEADIVYGPRFLSGENRIRFSSRVTNFILTRLVHLLFGVRLSDEATAYKLFRTEVLKGFDVKARGTRYAI